MISGIPTTALVIIIPQRFQTVYNLSPIEAGVRLIPFNLLISFACVVVNIVAMKTRIKPIWLLFIGSTLQVIGISLFATLSDHKTLNAPIYGFEIVSGFGIGMVIGILLVIPPQLVETRDLGNVEFSQEHQPPLFFHAFKSSNADNSRFHPQPLQAER